MTKPCKEITIALKGRIDSDNAAATEQEILTELEGMTDIRVILDAKELEYISSAGLRTVLRMRKKYPDASIVNVSSDVYGILEMTGFTQILPVEKAYREVSVDGCEAVGNGANGTIYRIDKDNIVKVYNDDCTLDEIMRERKFAKQALILGIPTAISYEIVKVGDRYGSVFELLDAVTFNRIIINDPSTVEWCVKASVDLLRKIHSTTAPEGVYPDVRKKFRSWIENCRDQIAGGVYEKLVDLSEAIPFDAHMIHGDYHTKNLMRLDDEVYLIDMETIATGHPVFEFAAIYDSYIGFSELDHENVKEFQGYDFDTADRIWHRTLEVYYETQDLERLKKISEKARVIGYIRMMDHVLRHRGAETPKEVAELKYWEEKLTGLIDKVDTLIY